MTWSAGYLPEEAALTDDPGADPDADPDDDPIADHRHEYEEDVALCIDQALVLLDRTDRDQESVRLRAVIDGVVLGACPGRLMPDEGVAVVERHLRLLVPEAPHLRAGAAGLG